jgi:putative transposase
MPYYRLFYHIVWATKDRLPLITTDNQSAIHAAVSTKITEIEGIVHALNSMPDHVHLVATIPPKIALATAIGQIKGGSSHLASRVGASEEPFVWQSEYGVVTLGERSLPTVMRDVQDQQEHHAANTLIPALEQFGYPR